MKQIAPCPKCKTSTGWFERRMQTYLQYYDPNGEPSHAADGEGFGRGGKRKFCAECNRDITKLIQKDE